MAKSVAKGVEAAGAEVKLYQVAETLPQDVLTKVRRAQQRTAALEANRRASVHPPPSMIRMHTLISRVHSYSGLL